MPLKFFFKKGFRAVPLFIPAFSDLFHTFVKSQKTLNHCYVYKIQLFNKRQLCALVVIKHRDVASAN
jgi:hypothetical protein